MSGQWEVVGKKKDKGSKLPIPKINSNNKSTKNKSNVLNGVKLEEVLPKSQVQNLYGKSKENKKPEKLKPQDGIAKTHKKDKTQEDIKQKPPKSIESALNSIDAEEFKSIFERSKAHFADGHIIWLKELVLFLNQKIPLEVQDPTFSSKPEGYPLCVVPLPIKSVIEKSIQEVGRSSAQLFFDICLTSMATDMGKGLSAIGYRFFLQYIAFSEPKLITANVSKYVTLRNSYQNRAAIGLSILWSVGQVGYRDIQSGLTVFQELFLPLLDMKNYSHFVAKYLTSLLNHVTAETSLTKEQCLLILDSVYSDKKKLSPDVKQELLQKTSVIKPALLRNNKEKYHSYVELLLKEIMNNSDKSYQDCLCDILVEIFYKDQTTLANWDKIYSKNIAASAILLKHIDNNWDSLAKQLKKEALVNLLNSFSTVNEELSLKKRVEQGLKESNVTINKINTKMVAKTPGGFPFRAVFFLTVLATSALIAYDIKKHGNWNDSRTLNVLKEYGIYEYSSLVMARVKNGVYWVDGRIEENFPGYHKTVSDFSRPYVQLFSDLGKIAYNIFHNMVEVIVEKYPVVIQAIESYAPGLIEQSQKAVTSAYSTSVLYFDRSINYLKKEVFIGQLSPENVQKVVVEALNVTQQKATEYYHWIYEKVQMTIK